MSFRLTVGRVDSVDSRMRFESDGGSRGQIESAAIGRDTKTVKKKTSSGKTKKKTPTSLETEIEYTDNANRGSFDGRSERDGDVTRSFQSGAMVAVCDDRKDPAQSDVFPAGTKSEN